MRLYCVFDVIANEGGPIMCAKNDAVAQRHFKQVIEKAVEPGDYKLIFLGSYNQETCIVNGYVGQEVKITMKTPTDVEEEQEEEPGKN